MLLDPNGAAFGVIPVVPAEAIPAGLDAASPSSGRIAWVDLTVPDAAATRPLARACYGVPGVPAKVGRGLISSSSQVEQGNVARGAVAKERAHIQPRVQQLSRFVTAEKLHG